MRTNSRANFVVVSAVCLLSVVAPVRADVSVPGDAATASPDTAAVKPAEVPEPSGDVRTARGLGVAEILALEPSVRLVGAGWRGHRASVARGALPATYTRVAQGGRSFSDWSTGGLDLMSVTSSMNGPRRLPSGPDLSLLPIHGSEATVDPTGPGALSVGFEPWMEPPARPYGRLTMTSGDLGERSVAAGFGRRNSGGAFGLGAFFERRSGRAPVSGGAYDHDTGGGTAVLGLSDAWSLELDARRTRHERGVPARDDARPLDTKRIESSVDVAASNERVRVGMFHDESWVAMRDPGGDRRVVEEARDGLSSRVGLDAGPIHELGVIVAGRRASGSAISKSERLLELECVVEGDVNVAAGWRVDVSGGFRWLGKRGYPVAGVTAVALGAEERSGRLFVDLSLAGRHATAVERLFVSPGAASEDRAVDPAGNESLEPEKAVSLSAGWSAPWLAGDAGVRAEVARLLGPIGVDVAGEDAPVLRNRTAETSFGLSLWASTGDTSRLGAKAAMSVTAFDPEGAIVEREPSPSVAATASAWFSHFLFARDYLDVRWEVSAAHEAGLASGPWDGLLDDAATTVSACVTAAAGSARVYALVDDLFDGAASRVPDLPGPGRVFSLGFSWSFWD